MRKFLKNELKFTISLIDMFTWVYGETHEESQSNRKGSQWALYNATVVYVFEHKGTPCVHYENNF